MESNYIADDEIDLKELFVTLWSYKKIICGFTIISTFSAVLISLFVLTVTYQSTAVLMPNTSASDMSKLSGLMGALPFGISGIPGLSGDSDSANLLAFLQSNSLKEKLIIDNNLLIKFYEDLWNEKAGKWDEHDPEKIPTPVLAIQEEKIDEVYSVTQDKKTELISISWIDESPEFTARIINQIINELQNYVDKDYVSDARREREFIEIQLEKAKKEMEYWEKQIPDQKLILSAIVREQVATQTVYTELRKQLELAKISEAKEKISFKVLDAPYIPVKKYKPKRGLICAIVMISSFISSCMVVLIWHSLRYKEENEGLGKLTSAND